VCFLKDYCSHQRSWEIFAESVTINSTSRMFYAAKCNAWNDFVNKQCSYRVANRKPFIMEIFASTELLRNFYLQTNGNEKFSKGFEGALYDAT
jgi:hypothetical protein